jgi:hypothetical protein
VNRLNEQAAEFDNKLEQQDHRAKMLVEDLKADSNRRNEQFDESLRAIEESLDEMNQFMEEVDTATADNLTKTGQAIEAIKIELFKCVTELKDSDANLAQEALFKEQELTKNF